MTINWFTVLAQIFNFLLLLFILKWVLYKPIFRFMKKRRNDIKNKIEKAEEKIKEAEEKMLEYDKKIEAFEQERKRKQSKFLSDLKEEKKGSFDN